MSRITYMYKDITPSDMPAEGASLYIHNGVYDEFKNMIGSEKGFINFTTPGAVDLGSFTYLINGIIPMDNNNFVVFMIKYGDPYNKRTYFDGEIGIVDGNGSYTIITGGNLSFSPSYPINGVFKRNFRNERVTTFTDYFNPPRLLNLDNPRVGTVMSPGEEIELKLFRNYQVPKVFLEDVQQGGSLETGVYYIFSFYEDSEGNRSEVLEVNNGIPVVDDSKSVGYNQYDGGEGGESSGKSISIRIENTDSRYSELVLGAIHEKNGQRSYYTFTSIKTSNNGPVSITFTGNESTEDISPDRILQERPSFSKVGSMVSLDKTLYLGRVQRADHNLDFQKYANNIRINYRMEEKPITGVKNVWDNDSSVPLNWLSYKRSIHTYTSKTVMPGEVYSIDLWFVMIDGSFSRAFHIPGRPPLEINNNSSDGFLSISSGYEDDKISDLINSNNLSSSHYLHNDERVGNEVRFFHTRDTPDNPNASSRGYSNLAFWQNENEFYPDTEDWEVWDENGKITSIPNRQKPRNNKVRHHKMPYYSNRNDGGNIFCSPKQNYVNVIRLEIDNLYIPQYILDQIQDVRIGFAKRGTDNATVLGQSLLFPSQDMSWIGNNTFQGSNIYTGPKTGSFAVPYNHKTEPKTFVTQGDTFFMEGEDNKDQDLYFKMHPFDMLAKNYSAIPSFVSMQDVYQIELDFTQIGTADYPDDYTIVKQNTVNGPGQGLHFDMTNIHLRRDSSGAIKEDYDIFTTPYTPGGNSKEGIEKEELNEEKNVIYPVSDSGGYVKNNSEYTDYYNVYAEQGFLFKLRIDTTLDTFHPYWFNIHDYQSNLYNNERAIDGRDDASGDNSNSTSPMFKLFNLHQFRTDVYLPFDEQEIFSVPLKQSNEFPLIGTDTSGIVRRYEIRGGDCYLSDYSFRTTNKIKAEDDGDKLLDTKALYTIFCITTSNANLRHEGSEDFQKYFPKLNDGNWDKLDFIDRPSYEGISVLYNEDYDAINDYNLVLPLSKDYNPRNTFNTLIARSEQDNLEKKYEPWRNFRTEDYYKIVDLKYGHITNLGVAGDRLIINLESASFATYGQTQLSTDTANAYIGSGDIFRGRPKELLASELGYAGTQSKFSCVSTEFGYIFYDEERRTLFLFSENFESISSNGLKQYFEDHMKLESVEQANRLLNEYRRPSEFDAPFAPVGPGIHIAYDSINNRLLITKKDYVILSNYENDLRGYVSAETANADDYNGNDLVYIDGVLYNVAVDGNGNKAFEPIYDDLKRQVDYNNGSIKQVVLEDKSETLSYDLKRKKWVSHHSYKPSLYIQTRTELFSAVNEYRELFSIDKQDIFKHNQLNKQGLYYDGATKEPFEIVIPVSSEEALETLLASFTMLTYCYEESSNKIIRDTTFDELIVSNNYQSSGIVPLVNKYSMRKLGQYWKANYFRDSLKPNVELILQNNWEPDPSLINQKQRYYKLGRFIDHYHLIKLRFNNASDDRLLYLHSIYPLLRPAKR